MGLQQKKIAVLFLDSIMHRKKLTQSMVDAWIRNLPETEILVRLHTEVVESAASGNRFQTWVNVAQRLFNHYQHFDGFVVVHPQEHLLRGMHMIAFMLGRVGKPVVYTTTPLEREEKQMTTDHTETALDHYFFLGLEINFLNALQCASISVPGYSFVFGDTLFPALRTFTVPSDQNQKFDTLDKDYWGVVKMGVQMLAEPSPHDAEAMPELCLAVEPHVRIIDTLNLESLSQVRESLGVLVKADSGEQEKASILRELSSFTKKRVPVGVFLGNTAENPGTEKIYHNCAILFGGMIWETAISKWMWVLGQAKDPARISRLLWNNRSGEYKK